MKSKIRVLAFIVLSVMGISCGNKEPVKEGKMNTGESELPPIKNRVEAYAPTVIKADLSSLNDREKQLLAKLAEAGHLADQIFWMQYCADGIAVRDSLSKLNTPEAKELYDYILINYGPYDNIYEGLRFAGNGPAKRPDGGNFYPVDMTKEEFEKYIQANPAQKADLESQYTIVKRENGKLAATPYHAAYPEAMQLAAKLDEAAELADNPSLKNYLKLRAKAIRTDDYYESDMAWMDIKDNKIDIVIGPIENYDDGLFNYKTAYEAVVMVRDEGATKELQMFENHINDFEHMLPIDKMYIRESAGKGNILQIVNVTFFGGDCQKGIKTIASSLPNDPKVTDVKGGKKSMFKNMMEAKFNKIVVPIAEKILDKSLTPFVFAKAFTSFVTLHEVSHTLGPGFVYGSQDLTVRKSLKERYSTIEETKADILGMYNHKHLLDMKLYDADYIKKAMATYLAGLYRSVRFGTEEAHGQANLIQLNFLRETGAITRGSDGKFNINEKIFFDKVAELAKLILTIEATGNYEEAGKIIAKYAVVTPEIKETINSLKDVPRDLNTTYEY